MTDDQAWVDWAVVERVLSGRECDRPGRHLTHAEKLAVASRIRRDGDGVHRLAKVLRTSWRAATALWNELLAQEGAAA